MILQKIRNLIDRATLIRQCRDNKRKPLLANREGQVAIVLLLLIALSLIMYAATINLGAVGQTKTMTTMAANVGASNLASQMASYGESIAQITLGGEREVCGWTGVIGGIIGLVISIITIIYGVITFNPKIVIQGVSAYYLSLTTIYLQLTGVQSLITQRWNAMTAEALGPTGSFLESGIRAGFLSSITDHIDVPDVYDIDQDGKFGFTGAGPVDTVSRFSIYYDKRMREITQPEIPEVLIFLEALDDFVYAGNSNGKYLPHDTPWGLYDPNNENNGCSYNSPGDVLPSECNVCCVPDKLVEHDSQSGTGGDRTVDLRSEFCDCVSDGSCDISDEIGTALTCVDQSPFGQDYPYVYKWLFEDATNTTYSFLENLGVDDEIKSYQKDPTQIDNMFANQISTGNTEFIIEDSTNFYTSDFYDPADMRRGIFPFFYKVADWGLELNTVDPNIPGQEEQCYWCDHNVTPGIAPIDCPASCAVNQPAEIGNRLSLPYDPASGKLIYQLSAYVDGVSNNTLGFKPLAADQVSLPGNIIADPTLCAQNLLENAPTDGFWKKGGDRFCADTDFGIPIPDDDGNSHWPYFYYCAKTVPGDVDEEPCTISVPPFWNGTEFQTQIEGPCECNDMSTDDIKNWPDDAVDDLIYGIPEFIEFAIGLLDISEFQAVKNFESWYLSIAPWIEKGTDDCVLLQTGETCAIDGYDCELCQENSGYLHYWWAQIRIMRDRLLAFREETDFGGVSCDDVWCVPHNAEICPDFNVSLSDPSFFARAEEAGTFDINHNNIDGDLVDVVACLDWNVNNTNLGGHTGNDEKFAACRETCKGNDCRQLPRSQLLVDDYNANDWTEPYQFYCPLAEVDHEAMIRCLDECNYENCFVNIPRVNSDPSCGWNYTWWDLYTFGIIGEFDPARECPGGVWNTVCGDNNDCWYDMITLQMFATNQSCDLQTNSGFMDVVPDPSTSTWLVNTGYSAREAANQVAKFEKRYDFLSRRLNELNRMIGILDEADEEFYNLLTCDDNDADNIPDGPACALTKAAIEYKDKTPNSAVYAWQDEEQHSGERDGLWHLVQVDARLPGRCDDACNVNQTPDGDPLWPRVTTEVHAWGTRRCYKLEDNRGVVKMRVTRMDQNLTQNTILFPNGQPIWTFRSSPNSPNINGAFLDLKQCCLDGLGNEPGSSCNDLRESDPDGHEGEHLYDGAFILGSFVEDNSENDNIACWKKSSRILQYGVTSETCAMYQPGGGGYSFHFVPCEEF